MYYEATTTTTTPNNILQEKNKNLEKESITKTSCKQTHSLHFF